MDAALFIRGAIIGLSIAAPVGPIGVLCIRRSIAGGFPAGFATGLGAAAADAFYGAVAGFGLSAISNFLTGQKSWIAFLGGAFLIYLGVSTLAAKPPGQDAPVQTPPLAAAFLSTFFLTLANPATIISFTAIFVSVGIGAAPSPQAASVFVAGVFCGSALWWLFLSAVTGRMRENLNPSRLRWANWISGFVLLAFGFSALAAGASEFLYK